MQLINKQASSDLKGYEATYFRDVIVMQFQSLFAVDKRVAGLFT